MIEKYIFLLLTVAKLTKIEHQDFVVKRKTNATILFSHFRMLKRKKRRRNKKKKRQKHKQMRKKKQTRKKREKMKIKRWKQ
jgi:hypothetical protein